MLEVVECVVAATVVVTRAMMKWKVCPVMTMTMSIPRPPLSHVAKPPLERVQQQYQPAVENPVQSQ